MVLGNMRDAPGRKVDREFSLAWAAREKGKSNVNLINMLVLVKLFEVSVSDRGSLVEFVHYLGQRHFHPTSMFYPSSSLLYTLFVSEESKFSLSKKLKSEKSNAAIVMDF